MDDIIELNNNFNHHVDENIGFIIIHIKSPTFQGRDIDLYINEDTEICTLKQKVLIIIIRHNFYIF